MISGGDWTEQTERAAEAAIGYVFRDKALLRTCFTHTSFANVCGGESNERLEFLGDAVLELCVSERLYRDCANGEGELTERRKNYVSRPALERAEARAGLMRFLRYSGGENNVGGKTASNLVEAVIGGVYLDGGLNAARELIFRCLSEAELRNYKTQLQEFVQGRAKTTPAYAVREQDGGYVCRVSALGKRAEGHGESKKAAETEAAKALLDELNKE